jgi:hypothetical protein
VVVGGVAAEDAETFLLADAVGEGEGVRVFPEDAG